MAELVRRPGVTLTVPPVRPDRGSTPWARPDVLQLAVPTPADRRNPGQTAPEDADPNPRSSTSISTVHTERVGWNPPAHPPV
jgi:hypothetical protein